MQQPCFKKAPQFEGKYLCLNVGRGDKRVEDHEVLRGSQYSRFVPEFLVKCDESGNVLSGAKSAPATEDQKGAESKSAQGSQEPSASNQGGGEGSSKSQDSGHVGGGEGSSGSSSSESEPKDGSDPGHTSDPISVGGESPSSEGTTTKTTAGKASEVAKKTGKTSTKKGGGK